MADNVDHDTATLDGRGTFHGMGIIASVTPGVKAARRVPRRDASLKDIKAIGQIKIHFFRSSSAKVWDIQAVQSVLGEDVCKHILFAHAIGGCDTVSGLFSIGKSIPFKKVTAGTTASTSTTVTTETTTTPRTQRVATHDTPPDNRTATQQAEEGLPVCNDIPRHSGDSPRPYHVTSPSSDRNSPNRRGTGGGFPRSDQVPVNLRHRWSNHKSDCKLRKGHKCHVAQHFLDKQHPVDPQFTCLRIFAIEAVHKKENLGKRETWWQVNVGTIFLGLNIRSDISALVRNRSRVQY
ncbi:hypothetical protein ACOMHN_054970 [Nucella lapillus]